MRIADANKRVLFTADMTFEGSGVYSLMLPKFATIGAMYTATITVSGSQVVLKPIIYNFVAR